MPAAKVEAAPDSPGKKGKFWEPRSTPQDKYKTVSNLDEMSEQETLMNELTGEGGEEDGMAGGGYALLHCTIVCSSCAI